MVEGTTITIPDIVPRQAIAATLDRMNHGHETGISFRDHFAHHLAEELGLIPRQPKEHRR